MYEEKRENGAGRERAVEKISQSTEEGRASMF
jgi:hypothetical protein